VIEAAFLVGRASLSVIEAAFLVGEASLALVKAYFLAGKASLALVKANFLAGKASLAVIKGSLFAGEAPFSLPRHRFSFAIRFRASARPHSSVETAGGSSGAIGFLRAKLSLPLLIGKGSISLDGNVRIS
jgi:hypothetical protein